MDGTNYVIKKGRTSLLVRIFIGDSTKTGSDRSGLTGLTSATSGLVCYRMRDDDGNAGATQVVLSAGTRGTWSSGGFVEKDSANAGGWYELGLPNAGQAAGSEAVDYILKGAANMAVCNLHIQLVNYDPQDGVALGLGALPSVAFNTSGGLGTAAMRGGTAQGGSATTITLDAGASATDNLYQDQLVTIISGTGAGQTRAIQTYVGATKVATIFPNWNINPDATSVFVLRPGGQVDVGNINNARTDGNNAVLSLAQLNIVNAAGNAIVATCSGVNGHGMVLTGNGTGNGLRILGGATGDGINSAGGGGAGSGMTLSALGTGTGLYVANGGRFLGSIGSVPGLTILGGPTGDALLITGGATSGRGIGLSTTSGIGMDIANSGTGPCVRFQSTSAAGFVVNTSLANSNAVNITGNGTGAAIQLAGGASGPGAIIKGGATSGDGLQCLPGPGSNAITASLIQGDMGGRVLGNTATSFAGVGVLTSSPAGGGGTQASWNFQTNTAAADPGSGRFRFNTATPSTSTQLYFDSLTNTGFDFANYFRAFTAGDLLTVQDSSNAANWVKYTLAAAPLDNTGWWTVAVTYISSAGTLPNNNSSVDFLWQPVASDIVAANVIEWKGANVNSLIGGNVPASLDSVPVETGLNGRQALALIAAACAGASSGFTGIAGQTPTYTGAGVATARIHATCDTNGNRSAVVLTPPA
jgi:hypothetical protein